MSKKNDKTINEIPTPWGPIKGKFSFGEACLLIICHALSWLVLKGLYLILFAVLVYYLKEAAIVLVGAEIPNPAKLFKQIFGNLSG